LLAFLKDSIRFEQPVMQTNQERLESTSELMEFRVVKVENNQGIAIRIDESKQFLSEFLPRIMAQHEAGGMPESHDGGFPNHSDFDLR
jgi:hypothetical protein